MAKTMLATPEDPRRRDLLQRIDLLLRMALGFRKA